MSGDSAPARLGLGCATLFQLPTARERRAVLEFALENGIVHYDVAPMYGLGRAEPELGEFLRSHKESVRVATKFGICPSAFGQAAGQVQGPIRRAMRRSAGLHRQAKQSGSNSQSGWLGRLLYREDYSPASARSSLERSLRHLRRDHIELFLVHEPAMAGNCLRDDVLSFLESARDSGKIGRWGLAGDLTTITALHRRPGALQYPYDIVDGQQGPRVTIEGIERVIFGFLSGGLTRCIAALHADPGLAAHLAAISGTAATPATIAALLVKDACAAAEGGTVLVSSTRRAHLRALIDAAASFRDDEMAAVGLLRSTVAGRRDFG